MVSSQKATSRLLQLHVLFKSLLSTKRDLNRGSLPGYTPTNRQPTTT